jgi:beta-lactamase regulating signal transducer with metallopeptidase domain
MMTQVLLYLGERTLWFGDGTLIKGAALLTAAAIAVRLCGRASAALRHLVWTLSLAGVLLISAGAWLLPAWTIDGSSPMPLAPEGTAIGGAARTMFVPTPEAEPYGPDVPAAGLRPALYVMALWPHLLFALWGLGLLVLLARLALDLRAARALCARAEVLTQGRAVQLLRALTTEGGSLPAPELRESREIDSPATIGILRPAIVLPPSARNLRDDELRGVLAHELAHARRFDCLTQLLARVACAAHWPNPLVWWAARRTLAEREMAADDAALRAGTVASDYAGLLLHLVEAAGGARGPALRGALSMTGGSPLGERVARLLDPVRSRVGVPRRLLTVGGGALAAVALALGCFGATSSPVEPAAEPRAGAERTELSAGQRLDLWFAAALPDSQTGRRLVEAAASDGSARPSIEVGQETWRTNPDGAIQAEAYLEGPRQALRGYVARLLAAQSPVSDEKVMFLGIEEDRARTVVVDMKTRVVLDRPDLSLAHDEFQRPEILMQLRPADAERVARLTGAQVGRKLAVVAGEDRLLSTPVVQSPLSDRGRITFGNGTEAEARALADALGVRGGPVKFPEHEILSAKEASQLMIGEPRIPSSIPLLPGESRWAAFSICVDRQGAVSKVTFVQGNAPEDLGQFESAVRTFRYRPYEKDGVAVPFCYVMRVEGQQGN